MAHVVTAREGFDDFVADNQYQGVSPATISFYPQNWAHCVRDPGCLPSPVARPDCGSRVA
jgi:hypothetical protein